MTEQPHPTLSQEITEKLTRRIVSGVYPLDSRLPTERALAEEFCVARHVVREALKRLEAIGLVRIRQGSGIYAQQMHFSAGVEFFDILLTHEDGAINQEFLKDVLEFRANTVRNVVQLAVKKHTPEELQEMRLQWRKLLAEPDPATQNLLRESFYEMIARSTHNQLYIRLYYTMGRIFIKLREMYDVPLVGAAQGQQVVEYMFDVIERRDVEAAGQLVSAYMQAVDTLLTTTLTKD